MRQIKTRIHPIWHNNCWVKIDMKVHCAEWEFIRMHLAYFLKLRLSDMVMQFYHFLLLLLVFFSFALLTRPGYPEWRRTWSSSAGRFWPVQLARPCRSSLARAGHLWPVQVASGPCSSGRCSSPQVRAGRLWPVQVASGPCRSPLARAVQALSLIHI